MAQEPEYKTVSKFDKLVGGLLGGNNLHTKPTTIEKMNALGEHETFIVQTVRDTDGDNVVLKYVDSASVVVKIVLPPRVTMTIARQSAALTARARSNTSKRVMQERMAAGETPGFMRKRAPAHSGSDGAE